ncbi:hypothetical protein B9Z55_004862 [Caenorhabditis nigoni]|uniref:Methyltransferase FkbM domain-containing protein n=1 Tax=Caenorhabditis nigoni TaxID=1611254 RepID=A0A2G5UYE9_9PELO|nr:hypothetical protein B9Z55_004862 [Caenorhabditis nigoni]
MDRMLSSSGLVCPSVRRVPPFLYILLGIFLFIVVVTTPRQTVDLSNAGKIGDDPRAKTWKPVVVPTFEPKVEPPKIEVVPETPVPKKAWDTLDGIGYAFEKINTKWTKTSPCDSVFEGIDIVPMANLHETKWTILPTCKEENIMVTLGIGHDTMAEEKLNITLPNTKFFGADPIIEPNRQLYTAFGKYFPFAIGKKPGFTKCRVLPNQNQKTRKYEFQDVTTIPFTYFLSDILGLKQIDIAWIDIEGGEFEFLDQLHRGGPMDKKGIVICQFNLEVHSKFHPPGAQVFHDFVFKVLDDKRYVFLKPAATDVGVHRMFFINLENEQCVRKFLQ